MQECLFYSGGQAEDQYYCSGSCASEPCADGEVCSDLVPGCEEGSICGTAFQCSAATGGGDSGGQQALENQDPCNGECGEFEVGEKRDYWTQERGA